jgi:phosphatidate cytidylyltransferase
MVLAILEFIKVAGISPKTMANRTYPIAALLLFAITWLDASRLVYMPFSIMIATLAIVLLLIGLFGNNDLLKKGGAHLYLFAYIALPFFLTNYMAFNPLGKYTYQHEYVLSIFIVIWSNDTFAYIAGSILGRTPFYQKVSPKKTWEGVIGGFLFALLTAYGLSHFFNVFSLAQWLIFGAIVSIAGTLGDLVESKLKRQAAIKDTGNIIPGHGGILDRIDSYLMAALASFVYIKFLHFI